MSVSAVRLGLRLWHPQLPQPDMAAILGIDLVPYAVWDAEAEYTGRGTAAVLEIFSRHDLDEADEEWSAELAEVFLQFAEWLTPMNASSWDVCRTQGYRIDVTLSYWLRDQMLDLTLPPALLTQLGRLGLLLGVYTEGFG